MPPKVEVRIIRCFEGPRHTRLERIWDTIAEYERAHIRLRIWPNRRCMSHGAAFNEMWRQSQDARYQLFTEYDFLPNLNLKKGLWTGVGDLDGHDAVASYYCTRHPGTKRLNWHFDKVGGWFVLIDTALAPGDLDFRGKPDACNQLGQQMDVFAFEGGDCWPLHFGVTYPFGVHLFWGRHLHDDPRAVVSGCNLGEIQTKHDRAVTKWIHKQPRAFQRLLLKRCGEEVFDAPRLRANPRKAAGRHAPAASAGTMAAQDF